MKKYEVNLTEQEWRKKLSPEEYRVLREKGTERAFTGDLWDHKSEGVYTCAACSHELFDSKTKYDSGSGWPSFWEPVEKENVESILDTSHGMVRTEVVCANCGSHLGHVFNDGPQPTNQRFCINSLSLDFEANKDGPQDAKDENKK